MIERGAGLDLGRPQDVLVDTANHKVALMVRWQLEEGKKPEVGQ